MSLSSIRAATRPLHEQLETVLDIPAQVKTRLQYGRLLQLFHALYTPWEERLRAFEADFAKEGIELNARLRRPWLLADLRALGLPPLAAAPPAAVPALANAAEAWGSLYVLEGSALGGQVLTRHFREALGLRDEEMHFFRSHGPDVGRFWKEFCGALDRAPGAEVEKARGAVDGFTALIAWFRENPVGER